jgi:hypothetical protein
MEKGVLERSGKPVEYWIDLLKKAKLEQHKEIVDFLKSEHGFTHGFANFISLRANKADAASNAAKDLVTNQYKGKEKLKPIYEKLLRAINAFGKDITITPKKETVSIIRKRQFVLIKPATPKRMDLGLKINDKPADGRLENSGPFGAMCTHRVKLNSVDDVDKQLIEWMKEAYDKSV